MYVVQYRMKSVRGRGDHGKMSLYSSNWYSKTCQAWFSNPEEHWAMCKNAGEIACLIWACSCNDYTCKLRHVRSQMAIQISGISSRQFVFPQFIVHNWRGTLHHLVCPGYPFKSLYISQLSPCGAQKDTWCWSVDCRERRTCHCSWFVMIVEHDQGWKCRCLTSGHVSTSAGHLYVAATRWYFWNSEPKLFACRNDNITFIFLKSTTIHERRDRELYSFP